MQIYHTYQFKDLHNFVVGDFFKIHLAHVPKNIVEMLVVFLVLSLPKSFREHLDEIWASVSE